MGESDIQVVEMYHHTLTVMRQCPVDYVLKSPLVVGVILTKVECQWHQLAIGSSELASSMPVVHTLFFAWSKLLASDGPM